MITIQRIPLQLRVSFFIAAMSLPLTVLADNNSAFYERTPRWRCLITSNGQQSVRIFRSSSAESARAMALSAYPDSSTSAWCHLTLRRSQHIFVR